MPKAGTPPNRRARDAQRQRAQEAAARAAHARAARRSRIVGIGVVAGVLMATVLVVLVASRGKESSTAATTTTATTGPTLPGDAAASRSTAAPVALPDVPPGASITGPTPCPAADGSSPRTTSFADPPPMCIDPTKDYTATIRTSKGTISALLAADLTPQTVNNFVVLSRYHYYDGRPVSRIVPRAWYEVSDGDGPGYTIPGEAPPGGAVPTAVMLAMVPGPGGVSGGAFLLGSGDQVAGVPPEATIFGTVLDMRVDPQDPADNRTVSAEIDKTGNQAGQPTEVVVVEGIDITEGPASR